MTQYQTITLADKTGDIAVVECNCDRISLRNDKPFVFTTNHFNNSDMLKYQYDGEDDIHSHKRYETLKNALSNCNCCVEFSKELLSGKKGFLCQYDKKLGIDTIWSSIFDLTDMIIYRAEGNPSRKKFNIDKRLNFYN